eukprot:gene47923-32825_t
MDSLCAGVRGHRATLKEERGRALLAFPDPASAAGFACRLQQGASALAWAGAAGIGVHHCRNLRSVRHPLRPSGGPALPCYEGPH